MTLIRVTALLAALGLISSCGTQPVDTVDSEFSLTLSAPEAQGVLAFVNDCASSFELLDIDAALDVRAARNIVEQRDGVDGTCGTADDLPFASIDALDAVPWVGDVALARLLAHAKTLGYLPAGAIEVEGVSFTAEEVAGVVAIANGASLEILDVDIALDARAAEAIIGARPFAALEAAANLQDLAALPYVGKSALEKLKGYVAGWSACTTASETVDGVAFSNLAAHDTLDLVNQAPATILSNISGIGAVLSERMINARPFETVAQISQVPGIGASLMANLLGQTGTRWCPVLGARCGCPAGASYRPPYVGFDENGLYQFLAYGNPWTAERVVDSGFISHDGSQVVLTDVSVPNDPDQWQGIVAQVFSRLWDCCLTHQFFGTPLELGSNRKGTLHLGRVINAHDDKPYVMAYWQDIDDASFGWIFEKDSQGQWVQKGEVFLN